MIIIPVKIEEDGSATYSEPLPEDRIYTVVDDVNYTCYMPGDTLPTTPANN